jgi:hypothetical protein
MARTPLKPPPHSRRHHGRVALALLALVLLVALAAIGWSTLLKTPVPATPAALVDGSAIGAPPRA